MKHPKPQHANAHIVTHLDHKHEMGEWHEPHGTTQHVAHVDEKHPGIIYHARLGASGLQLLRGGVVVCIPLPVLIEAAGRINPKFTAAPDKSMTEAEIVATAEKLTPN